MTRLINYPCVKSFQRLPLIIPIYPSTFYSYYLKKSSIVKITYLIVFQKQLLLKIIYKFMSTHKYVYLYNVKNININKNIKNEM